MSENTVPTEDQLKQIFLAVYDNIRPGARVHNLRKAGFQVKLNHLRYHQSDAQEILKEIRGTSAVANRPEKLVPYFTLRTAHREGLAPTHESYISATGGCTEMAIISPHDTKEFKAKAICCLYDPYERSKGVQYCLQRIFAQMLEHYKVEKAEVKQWALEAEANAAIAG